VSRNCAHSVAKEQNKNPMNRLKLGQILGLLALTTLPAGCNVVLNLDTAQCTTTSDCAALGPSFANTVCQAGDCVVSVSTGGSSSAGIGEFSVGGGGNVGGNGDTDSGSTGGAAAAASTTAGCTTNADCVSANFGEPYACLTPGKDCVALKTQACPLVFGDYQHENAVYFGAFLDVPATSPLSQMSTLNVRLAVDEFNGSVGGLPGGPLGKLRPLVAVVCRNDQTLIEDGAVHLIQDLGVPAVLSHLPSEQNKRFFADHAIAKQMLVMNPGFADNTLTSLSTEGLFWHVIGDIRDVGAAYIPLIARIESYLASTEPLRVAMLVSNRYAEESIADTITPKLTFNGKSVTGNGSNFFTASVTALADDPNADYAPVVSSLLAFRPHVVIAITREEFVSKILPAVEGGWTSAAPNQNRPFYVLPTALSGNLDLLNYVAIDSYKNTSEAKRTRIVGVAPASAEDLTLYDQFMVRFRTANPYFQNPGGFENFYDAAYLLANAMFAAGSVAKLSGPDIARGMQRIIAGNVSIDVGPMAIADGFSALAAGGNIRINGTMGPADFDPGTGSRRGNGSVYCIQRSGSQLSFMYDVLRYDKTTQTLNGSFPCFAGF
jgi:branched-chain amino acid transport system substrate-binding protein